MSLDEWNERWRVREQINDEPSAILVRAAEALPPGRALDLACGAGRHALWLARKGWQVDAVDGSEQAIGLLRERIGDLPITTHVRDLETREPLPWQHETFDLVAILYYLHCPLFDEAKRVLRPGGTIVCAVRTSGRYRVRPGDLRTYFADFDVVYAHDAEIAELIARKPVR